MSCIALRASATEAACSTFGRKLIVDALPVSAVQALVPMCVADCGPDVFKGVQVLLAVDGRKGCAASSLRDCKENTEEAQP